MKNSNEIKESIISVTSEMIEQSGGNINNITARAIAGKCGIALGLINYHFGSKDNLIAYCIQRSISKLLMNFVPSKKDYNENDGLTDKERLINWGEQIFEFLQNNYAVAKISILSDFKDYQEKSNSVFTQMGLRLAIRKNIPEDRKKLIAFSLASMMQTAILMGDNSNQIIGYDFKDTTRQKQFISDIVEMLMPDMGEDEADAEKE